MKSATSISSAPQNCFANNPINWEIILNWILSESNSSIIDADISVLNPVHVRFIAAFFAIPLKDGDGADSLSYKRFYDHLSLLFGYVFLTNDDFNGFALRPAVLKAYKTLDNHIKSHVTKISRAGNLKALMDEGDNQGLLGSYGGNLIQRLLKAGKTVDDITKNIIIPSAVTMVANLIQQVTPYPFSANLVCCDDRRIFV